MPVEEFNGTPISYETSGAGEPLVLVHGAWVDRHTWDFVVPTLAEALLVVTYDLRGHGDSEIEPPGAGTVHDDVADLAGLVETLDIAPANIAGNSSGACIALRMTTERPELVRRALAHEPPVEALLANDPSDATIMNDYTASIDAVRALLEAGDHRGAAERFVDTIAVGPGAWSQLPPFVQDTFVAHATPFLGQLDDPDALVLDLDALAKSSTPLLLSQGDHSPAMFRPIMEQLDSALPHATPRTLVNAGHVPHMTSPDEYAAMLTEFIQG
jgi:pimeloyl-ACP methyl ester carboxylesterase